MDAYKRQHKTVQEYAAWRFQSFPATMGQADVSVVVPEIDFEGLRTIEEVDAAWSRVHRIAEDAANEQRNSLPMGQPEGVMAFADARSPSLTRGWREFTPRDLYPVGYAGTANVRTLMAIDTAVASRSTALVTLVTLGPRLPQRSMKQMCRPPARSSTISRGCGRSMR